MSVINRENIVIRLNGVVVFCVAKERDFSFSAPPSAPNKQAVEQHGDQRLFVGAALPLSVLLHNESSWPPPQYNTRQHPYSFKRHAAAWIATYQGL